MERYIQIMPILKRALFDIIDRYTSGTLKIPANRTRLPRVVAVLNLTKSHQLLGTNRFNTS
jgi:hypothetical protein